MDATIKYVRKIPVWKVILGFAALGVGVLGLVLMDFVPGIVSLLFGLIMLKTEGSEINLESQTFRKTTSVVGFSFGKWQTLQNPEYISVFNTTEDITIRALTAETTNSLPIIVLNIFYGQNKKITVYKTKNVKDAFDVAAHISDALLIDLLDATEKGNFKWVDKDLYRDKGEIVYID